MMICFYHDDMDGRCAGAIVHKAFPRTKLQAINYGQERLGLLPEVATDEDIWFVDFCPQNEEFIWKLLALYRSRVLVIDHHKSNQEKMFWLGNVGRVIFDITKSGCQLTWEYLYGVPSPLIVQLIEDRDLWKFGFGDLSRFVHEGLMSYDTAPDSPKWEDWLGGKGIDDLETRGLIICEKVQRDIEYLAQKFSQEVQFEGYRCLAVNAPGTGELGEYVYKKLGYQIAIAFTFGMAGDSLTQFISLYTEERGDIDVSEIAKRYGGGGHKGAAGFQRKWGEFLFV